MAAAGRQLDFGGLGGQGRRVASGRAKTVQPGDPGGRRGVQVLLVALLGDLEHERGRAVRRQRLGHREYRGQRRLVADEQVPVGRGRRGDLPPRPDALDPVAGPGRPHPALAGTVAVQHDVQREQPCGRVKPPDCVAPPYWAVTLGRHQQHHVLARQVTKPVQLRRGQPEPLHVRGEPG